MTFTIRDIGPAVNTSTPPSFWVGSGTVSSSIASAATTPQITYTVSGLDFSSVGGTNNESVTLAVTFTATGGSVAYNALATPNGNIYVGPNGTANQIDPGETLTTTVVITGSTFNLSNLSVRFSNMVIGGYDATDAIKLIHAGGEITRTGTGQAEYTFPESSTNYFTMDPQTGVGNMQRYDFTVTAVPEPSALLLGGLGLLGLLRRRRSA